eukprot:NODE_70_length_23697_cov_0.294771.p9 type:complete len:310 gc:universal NODE_70_length_23697_cov_0.294771:15367-16296(+)
MQWVLQIVLMMGIPYAIQKFSNWRTAKVFTKQEYRLKEQEKRRGHSIFANVLLLTSLVIFGYLILNPDESMFTKIGLSPKTRNYELRNTLRSYLSDMIPSDPAYHINSMDPVSISGATNDYDKIKVWYEMMKNKGKRSLYTSYGDAIYCEFCKYEIDYAFYYAPEVLKCYLGLFLLIGLVTMTYHKSQWRLSASVFAASMLVSEMSLIFMSKETLDMVQYSYAWDRANQARHVLFFLLTVAMLAQNKPNVTKDDTQEMYCDELDILSFKIFKIAKLLQLKQQVDSGSTIGPIHPSKKHLLQHIVVEREI